MFSIISWSPPFLCATKAALIKRPRYVELRPQNGDEYVALQRHCQNGQGESARHLCRLQLSSMRCRRTQSGGHECRAVSA